MSPILAPGHRGLGREPLRVLVTSAGRRVELVRCFRRDGEALPVPVEVCACDVDPGWSAACRVADRAFRVPPIVDPGYASAVLELCRAEGIRLLVPTVDPELAPLAAMQEAFAAAGIELAISSCELIAIARDKLLTAMHLAAHGVPTPRTMTLEAALAEPDAWSWPVLVKPRHGSAGRAVTRVGTPAELAALRADEPMIVQTLLSGPEHTVNLFLARDGVARAIVPHLRHRVRAGEVEKAITVGDRRLRALGQQLAGTLPAARGVVCFQTMEDAGGWPAVFEINARFGGGFPIAHYAGARFTLWLMEEALGLPASAHDHWREGAVMLRYDAAVFLNGPA